MKAAEDKCKWSSSDLYDGIERRNKFCHPFRMNIFGIHNEMADGEFMKPMLVVHVLSFCKIQPLIYTRFFCTLRFDRPAYFQRP